jgi:hypothetical protein
MVQKPRKNKKSILSTRLILVIFLALVSNMLLLPSQEAKADSDPGWLSGWDKRIKLTIDHNDIDAALSDFPILVYISASSGKNNDDVSFIFDELQSDANRKKIAVTTSDGTTQCYVEIEKWDTTNKQAWLWVKIPSVSSATDTDLYLYYDKTQPDNTTYVGDSNSTPAENVWDSNFKMVQHMKDETVSTTMDSTANNNDGTKKAADEPIQADGQVGKAQSFDGTNDYIALSEPPAASTNINTGSVFAWIKTSNAGSDYRGIVVKQLAYGMFLKNNVFIIYDWGNSVDRSSGVNLADGSWHYIGFTFENIDAASPSNNAKLYIDGVYKNTVTYKLNSYSEGIALGAGDNPGTISQLFKGLIDEVHISNISRSAAWIRASYESERDHLLDFGSEEIENQAPNTPTNISPTNGAVNQSLTPTLIASAFSDPEGDSHVASQWQIRKDYSLGTEDYSAPFLVYDSGETTTSLTSISVPSGTLSNDITYYWHVRYKDSFGKWSNYSTEETSFSCNKPLIVVAIGATEYKAGETAQLVVQVKDANGDPINDATCTIDIFGSDNSLLVDDASMNHIASSDGLYYYNYTTSAEGVYKFTSRATYNHQTGYTSHTFHIAPWATDISNLPQNVWEYSTRTLTDYANSSIAEAVWGYSGRSLDTVSNIAQAVWEYSNRSLTSFGTLTADIWGYSTRGLTTFGTLVADIWSYSTRSLTAFGTLVADVWNNATRTLTGAGLDTGQLAVQSDITSQTAEIKGTSDKDLTDISGEIAGVQSTVDSIEAKVNSLNIKVDTISTDVNNIVARWGSYSASDVIGYVDGVETALGDNADTCALDDTVFGNIQCVRDKWGEQTADVIYTAADNAYDTVVLVRAELEYNGKSTTAYEDIQTLAGYVDSLKSSIGTSSDTAETATVFGRIKKVQDKVDQLDRIDTTIDTLISKWGSYKASDVYDKVKNLSSEISDINTVSDVSSILSLAQTNATNMTDLKNKVLAMKAVVDVNRMLLDGVAHQPIIKTWLEEGSIIFKTLITNPSKVSTQTVPLKYYLPREAKKEDIIEIDEELKVEYDASEEAYYITGEFELEPGGTKTFSVEVADVWKISEDEVNSLRTQTEELFRLLEGTTYFAQGSTIKNDINVSLDKVLRLQQDAHTPEARIRAYREGMIEIEGVQRRLDDMKTLVSSAGSMGTMFGFIGGVQTLAVWGLIIVLIAGFVFLALYTRTLRIREKQIEKGIKETVPIDFWGPVRNIKNQLLKTKSNKKIVKIGVIVLLVAVGVFLAVKAVSYFKNLPAGQYQFGVRQEKASFTPTTEPSTTTTPVEKRVKVLNTEVNYLNVRGGPGRDYEKTIRVDVGDEFVELERKENEKGEEWVKIKIDEKTEGWMLGKYVEVVQGESSQESGEESEFDEIQLSEEKQVLGKTLESKVRVIVPEGVNGVNVREKPSLDSEVLTHFWATKEVNKLGEQEGWVKIEIDVEKDGVKYSEGWVSKQLVERIGE